MGEGVVRLGTAGRTPTRQDEIANPKSQIQNRRAGLPARRERVIIGAEGHSTLCPYALA